MKVHELLSDRSKWTQGNFAVDSKGDPVPVYADAACAWCVAGAIRKCYPVAEQQFEAADRLRGTLADLYKRQSVSIVYLNDFLGYDDAMAALRAADV